MRVSRLVPDPQRTASTRVVVGGRVAWTVPTALIEELHITPGQELTGAVLERLEAAADQEGALRAAFQAVERRAHGIEELRGLLTRRGHPAEAVTAAIARLLVLRLLDDRAYASEYVRSRLARGRAPQRIARELRERGVEPGIIAEVVRPDQLHAEGEDPLAKARALVARRAPQLASLPRLTRQRRLLALLQRRGYSAEDARTLVSEALAGQSANGPEPAWSDGDDPSG